MDISASAISQYAESMEISHAHLTPEEHESQRINGLCFYCGSNKHKIHQCSELSDTHKRWLQEGLHKQASLSVSLTTLKPLPTISLEIMLHYANQTFPLSAMIDSVSSGNFIDDSIAEQLKLIELIIAFHL